MHFYALLLISVLEVEIILQWFIASQILHTNVTSKTAWLNMFCSYLKNESLDLF